MRGLKHASSPAMGYDKDTPRKPTLAARTVTRTPLTPRIASATSPRTATSAPSVHAAAPSSYHISNNVTPRTGARQSRVDSGNSGSSTPNHGTPTAQSHWDVRSGLGIAGHAPAISALDERLRGVAGQAASATASPDAKFFYASDARSTPVTAAAPAFQPSIAPSSRSPTFIYASGQLLSGPQQTQPSPQPTQQPQPQLQQQPPRIVSPSVPSAASSPPDRTSKFIHANGATLKSPGSIVPAAHGAAPPKLARTPSTVTAPPYAPSQQRPLSPVKAASTSAYPLQKSGTFPLTNGSSPTTVHTGTSRPAPLPSNPCAAPQPSSGPLSPGGSHIRLDLLPRQRNAASFGSSIGSSSSGGGGHSRKTSLTMADAPTVARLLQSPQPSSETSSPASVHVVSFPFPTSNANVLSTATSSTATGLAAILQATDDLIEPSNDDATVDGTMNHDGIGKREPQSSGTDRPPTPSFQTQSVPPTAPADDLVTNARRERKVQDLEITNASLEAINRSLERQLRKQKSELRQFRRLSRSGRLSLAPSSASAAASRVTSGASTVYEGPLQDPDRLCSILSDDESDATFDDGDDDASDMEISLNEDEDDEDEDEQDSSGKSRRQNRRRERDERRLQLDLSKHRQLLVDSQKINQSIKRCLGWTEELIQEGRKALAFQVRVSEVQLGGRVLAADDLEGEPDRHVIASIVPMETVGEAAARAGAVRRVAEDDAQEVGVGQKADMEQWNVIPSADSDNNSHDLDHVSHDDAFSPVSHNRTVHFDVAGIQSNATDKRAADQPVENSTDSLDASLQSSPPKSRTPATPRTSSPTNQLDPFTTIASMSTAPPPPPTAVPIAT